METMVTIMTMTTTTTTVAVTVTTEGETTTMTTTSLRTSRTRPPARIEEEMAKEDGTRKDPEEPEKA
jgi:hypothetical protein